MTGWERPGTGPWTRRVLLLTIAAVTLATTWFIARPDRPSGRLDVSHELVRPAVDPAPTAWPDARPGRWRVVPRSPLTSRSDYAVVWTGSEMIVWGGFDAADRPQLDGAAFDPASGTWRELPTTAARDPSVVGVASGTDVVFVSPTETRRYDPAERRWRAGPVLPLPRRHALGDRIVAAGWRVVAVTEPSAPDGRSAIFALSPGAERWQRLPDVPVTMTDAHALVTAGSEVMVFGPPVEDQPAAMAIDLDTSPVTWYPIPAPPRLGGQRLSALTGVAAGDRIMLWGTPEDGAAAYAAVYDHSAWRLVDPGPMASSRSVRVLWTGDRLLVWDRMRNAGALLDPEAARWERIPPPPLTGLEVAREALWTGSGLLVWGALATGGALYTP